MDTNVIIVGAGPIGIEVASVLKRNNVDYLHLEAGQIGQTICGWPQNTQFFSSPEWIAVAGMPIQTVAQERITGEQYLAYLRQVVETLDLPVQTYERVTAISRRSKGFTVETRHLNGATASYTSTYVVIAVGDMSHPRRMGIPGEDLPHVAHRFADPHRYFRNRLLIVGGRNSAVEAAIRCWRAGADATISYRQPTIPRNNVISRLHLEISLLFERGQVEFLPQTVPIEIRPGMVRLERPVQDRPGRPEILEHSTDFVLLCTGFRPDTSLYECAGVKLLGPENHPVHDPDTMETNVPGLYVAGTTTAGNQRKYTVFITTCHDHAAKILRHITGRSTAVVGNLPRRDYPLSAKDIE
jgi:thioredoxin reductase (NADPH)